METLRKEIDEIFDKAYSEDLGTCPLHTIFQQGKACNELIDLFQLKLQQERERILTWVAKLRETSTDNEDFCVCLFAGIRNANEKS